MNPKTTLTPAALIAIHLFLILYVLPYRAGGEHAALQAWSLIAPVLSSTLAVGAAWRAFRASPAEEQASWFLLGTGLGLWMMAEGTWAGLLLGGSSASALSWADAFRLPGYLAVGAGLELYLHRRRAHLSWIKVAVACTAAGVMTLAIGKAVVIPMLINGAAGQGLERILNVAYPVMDATLVAAGLLTLLAAGGRGAWQPWCLIGGALVLWAYSDLCLAFFNWAGAFGGNGFTMLTVDLPHNLAYLLAGVGGLQAALYSRRAPVPVARPSTDPVSAIA